MMKKVIVALSVGLFTVIANAQYISAGKLVNSHYEHDYGKSFAIGYILGVVDSYEGTAFCIPDEVKSGQLRDLVIGALEENPQLNEKTAADLIFKGFSGAYPCQGKKQGSKLM